MVKAFLQRTYDQRLKVFFDKYERWLIPGLLFSGFIFDVITFRTLQIQTTLAVLGVHASLAGLAVLYSNFINGLPSATSNSLTGKFVQYLKYISELVLQFTFGSLLSNALIFYWYSGAFFASWPMVILLVVLITGNEVFRDFYLRPAVQLSLYSFVLFSYFSLILPYIFTSLSPWLFVAAGLGSTSLVLLLVAVLARLVPAISKTSWRISGSVLSVTAIMYALYFLNIIPPIPLSVRDAGVYHSIVIQSGEYVFEGESEAFPANLIPGQTVHASPSDNIFVYTAIYAPAELTTVIYHQWQFYDPVQRKWLDRDRLPFTIRGGRGEGFRGYTFKSRLTPGKWRVTVQTSRGQVLGRVPFTVVLPE